MRLIVNLFLIKPRNMDYFKNRQITFDLFIRGCIIVLLVIGAFFLLKRLSSVLLPFGVAWLIAYLMHPLVCFLQHKCRLKYRIVAILVAFALVGGALYGVFMLIFPPMIEEALKVKDMLVGYLQNDYDSGGFSATIRDFLKGHLDVEHLKSAFTIDGLLSVLQESMPKIWGVVSGSFRALSGIFSVTMGLLYLLFILLDYERLIGGWQTLLPERWRKPVRQLVTDIEDGMNKYFRGQALVALCVGILFCIGFLIIGFPMAVAMGLFIGLLNMVPYLQIASFIPLTMLATVKAADTGESFWMIMLSVLIVFAIVQTIQDTILTPKIMGKVTGLNSAIILLSLSIWGSLLGLLGMIIALPLTTLLLTYYQRYIVRPLQTPKAVTGPPEDISETAEPIDNPSLPEDDSTPSDV